MAAGHASRPPQAQHHRLPPLTHVTRTPPPPQGTLDDGEVFDTSRKEDSKPLEFQVRGPGDGGNVGGRGVGHWGA